MTNYISSLGINSTFSVTSTAATVNESGNISFDITASGYGTGILYWVITGTVSATDFSDTGAYAGLSGKVLITNNSGRVTKTLNTDKLTEGTETFQLELHACESTGTLLATSPVVTINDTSIGTMYTLVVAGGGGGGGSGGAAVVGVGGGGGGGGGYVYSATTAIVTDVTYFIAVGNGGAAGSTNTGALSPGANGENSSILGSSTSITAIGGGGGGGYFNSPTSTTAGGQNGLTGGSGGGGSSPFNAAGAFTGTASVGGTSTSGQGNAGGGTASTRSNAGGGGGATAVGVGSASQPYGAGGAGITLTSPSPYSSQSYSGGGAGWASTFYNTVSTTVDGVTTQVITGARGGGGLPGEPGTPFTGGGGGGGGENTPAGAGGKGVVKIAYTSPLQSFYGGTVVINPTTGIVTHTFEEPGFFSRNSSAPTFSMSVNYNEIVADAVAGLIEGNGTITYTITTTNYGNGILGWESFGVDKSSFSDNVIRGTVVITNNAGVIVRPTVNNTVSEAPRTLTMTLKSPDYKSLLASNNSVIITDQYTITPDIYSVVELGSPTAVTFTIVSQAVANGTVVFWSTTSSPGITARDFVDNTLTGYVTIQNNSATLVREAYADYVTEGAETFGIQLRSGSSAGTILSVSSLITIGDTTTVPPTVTSFNPAKGPATGGTATPTAAGATYDVNGLITITGSGFTNITDVIFWDLAKNSGISATYTVVSSTQITAVPPAFSPLYPGFPIVSPEYYRVKVYVVRGTTSSSRNATQIDYQYVPAPSLSFTDPTGGQLIEQHTQIFVKGNNFNEVITTIWNFGGAIPLVSAGFTVGAWTEGYVTPPIRNTAGTATITLYTYGGASNTVNYQYSALAPDIQSYDNIYGGPLGGGFGAAGGVVNQTGKIVILGFYFTGATSVKFNGVPATFTFVDRNRIDANPPAQTGTSLIDANIEIITSQGTGNSSTNSLAWRYWPKATLSSWNFETGPSANTFKVGDTFPTRLRIYGTNINTLGVASVTYSGNGGYNRPIINDFDPNAFPGYLRAEPPSGAFSVGGVFTITLNTLGGPSNNTLTYYVVGTPTLAVAPSTSTVTPGSTITITLGGGFTDAAQITSVTVGGITASYTINSSGVMTITIPGGVSTGALQNIVVTTINGTVNTSVVTIPSLTNALTGISVSAGGKAGTAVGGFTGGEQVFLTANLTIVISGTTYNFLTSTSAVIGGVTRTGTIGEVWFGNRRAAIGTVTSTGVYVTAPTAVSAGTVSVTIKSGSLWGGQTSNAQTYTYGNYLLAYVFGIGGGGGGFNGTTVAGGSGGGGGAVTGTWKELTFGSSYTISVGAGGAVGVNGTISTVSSSMLSVSPGTSGTSSGGGVSGSRQNGYSVIGTKGGGGGGSIGTADAAGNGGPGVTSSSVPGLPGPPYNIPWPIATNSASGSSYQLGAGGGGGLLVSTAGYPGQGGMGAAFAAGGGNGGGSTTLIAASSGVENCGGGGGGGGGTATTTTPDSGSYYANLNKKGPFGTVGTNVNYFSLAWTIATGSQRYDSSTPTQISFNGSSYSATRLTATPQYWSSSRTGFTDITSQKYFIMSSYVVVAMHTSNIANYGVSAAGTGYGLPIGSFNSNRPIGWYSVVDLTSNGYLKFTSTFGGTARNNNYGGFDDLTMAMGSSNVGTINFIGYKFTNFSTGQAVGGFSALCDVIIRFESTRYEWEVTVKNIFRFAASPYDKPSGLSQGVGQTASFGTSFVVAWNKNQNIISTVSIAGGSGGSGKVVLSYLSQKGVALNLISNSSGSITNTAAFFTNSDGVWNSYAYLNSTTSTVAAITQPIVIGDR